MSLDQIISQYGYIGVSLGAFLQSDSLLLAGGLSAHRGYLELPWVMACAFIGTYSGTQFYFFIGQQNGKHLLQNRPAWEAKSAKVQALLNRHEWFLFLIYRFVPGLAMLTPFLVGSSGFSPPRFAAYNVLGALIWSVFVALLGSMFGETLKWLFGDIHHYETWLFGSLLLLAIAFLLRFLYTSRKNSRQETG